MLAPVDHLRQGQNAVVWKSNKLELHPRSLLALIDELESGETHVRPLEGGMASTGSTGTAKSTVI